jgi:bifunctional non-homologous end joining protein LigD
MLETLVAKVSPAIRFSPSIKADSARLMREMKARGLEGLIGKRRDSKYEVGRRSGGWVKFKWTNEQEFVIGGYTQPKGTRTHFGALLIGYYEKNKLLFAAKVGTGFDQKLLESLYNKFKNLIRPDCPFANLPEKRPGSSGLSAAEMRRCTWLEPKLVCQVRFAEWTRDNHLRQPAFLGLREDKRPKEVVREKAK